MATRTGILLVSMAMGHLRFFLPSQLHLYIGPKYMSPIVLICGRKHFKNRIFNIKTLTAAIFDAILNI